MHRSQFLKDKHLHYKYPEILSGNKKVFCEPLTISAIALTAAAGGMTAYGQVQQGKAQSKMYQYQASLALQNVKLTKEYAEQQKKSIETAATGNITAVQGTAAEESKRLAREITLLTGTQKATIGALGIGGVTAADIAASSFDKAKANQLALRYNADVRSWEVSEEAKRNIWGLGEETKYKVWSLEEEAKSYGAAAKNARRAANISAATTLLSTAASMATIGAMSIPKTPTTNTAEIAGMGKVNVAPKNYYLSRAARF